MAFIDKTIEVEADVQDVYEAWTAFEDYPEFMETIETVTLAEEDRLHWVAVVEDDTFEWDADLVEHLPDEKVTWRAIDGRETGEVRFEKLAADKTEGDLPARLQAGRLGRQTRHRAPLDEPPRREGPRGLQGDGRSGRLGK